MRDPRDPWARTRRMELVRYAAELGIDEINEQMPHPLIVRVLKQRYTPIGVASVGGSSGGTLAIGLLVNGGLGSLSSPNLPCLPVST